jgi:hypothetical protein
VFDTEGSKAVSAHRGPAIIIAGAGMASGGRVVHHLERFLPERRTPSRSWASRPPAPAAVNCSTAPRA